jgi:hypothetical protein
VVAPSGVVQRVCVAIFERMPRTWCHPIIRLRRLWRNDSCVHFLSAAPQAAAISVAICLSHWGWRQFDSAWCNRRLAPIWFGMGPTQTRTRTWCHPTIRLGRPWGNGSYVQSLSAPPEADPGSVAICLANCGWPLTDLAWSNRRVAPIWSRTLVRGNTQQGTTQGRVPNGL